MINGLVCLLIAVIFSADYLKAEFSWVPRLVTWSPEALSGLLLLFVALSGKNLRIPGKYLLLGLMLFLLMAIGVIANDVQPGAVFYGARKYLRCLPLLLIPLVYRFSERELKLQLSVVLALALIQIFPALYQRFVEFASNPSGDVVVGTVMGPAQLTILQIGVVSVLTAFYIKRLITFPVFLVAASVLLVPTFINETAASVVLLPLALALPLALSGNFNIQIRRFVPIGIATGLLFGAFLLSYSSLFDRWGGDPRAIVGESGLEYFYRGANEQSRADDGREQSEIGRLDSVLLPFRVLDDPVQWFVGVGIGNASTTFNDVFRGDYPDMAERYGANFTTAGVLIWELGTLGLLLTLVFLWMVFRGARQVSVDDSMHGALALGIASLLALLPVIMLYRNIVDNTVLAFLFALLTGHAIAMHANRPQAGHEESRGQSRRPQARGAPLLEPWSSARGQPNVDRFS